MRITPALLLLVLGGCAAAAPRLPARTSLGTTAPQIVTPDVDGTEEGLLAQGEKALEAQDWALAKRCFGAVVAAGPQRLRVRMRATLGLAVASEGLFERERARDLYAIVVRDTDDPREARSASVRTLGLLAYLEAWPELGTAAAKLLDRTDLDPVDRMTGLGARGLSRIEAGDVDGAQRDVQNGLDIVDENRFGAGGRLPAPVAQLRFAAGEIRRLETERISLFPVTEDFVVRISARCQGLLDAQGLYADAMRADDPHWITMSGYRVGQMYRALHRELMNIPPDGRAKDEHQRQVFYGIMHMRYRALLDKGIEMLRRTLVTAERVGDTSPWVQRAKTDKDEMELALDEEKKTIATFPFNEGEIELALVLLEKQDRAKREKLANTPKLQPQGH